MLNHAQAKIVVDHWLKYSSKETTTSHTPLTAEVLATGEAAEVVIAALLEAGMPVEEPVTAREAVVDEEAEVDPEEDEAMIVAAGADVVDEVVSRAKVVHLQHPLQPLQLEATLDLH